MSVFRVNLSNAEQGLLDLDPSTASSGAVTGQGLGDRIDPSVQRGVYVMINAGGARGRASQMQE